MNDRTNILVGNAKDAFTPATPLNEMNSLLSFADDSRVWIYQADRFFSGQDVDSLNKSIAAFCIQWTSHARNLRATGGVLHNLFVVLVVDETLAPASGCSIDSSVAFIKSLERQYERQLLLRHQVAWIDTSGALQILPLQELAAAVRDGRIGPETLVFDNLVSNRKDFLSRWVVPLERCWMQRFA